MRKAYRVTLKDGRSVVLAELRPHEMLNALKLAGTSGGQLSQGIAASAEALKLAIREVDGVAVDATELQTRGLRAYLPRTRDRSHLGRALGRIHAPTEDEVQAVLDSAVVEDDGEREVWTVTLPDGRKVALAEPGEETVGQALDAAAAGARSGGAQELLATFESLRRSIRSVDGQAPDLEGRRWDEAFSMRDTHLLKRVWAEMHDGGEDVPVGELKPVPGTP